MKEKNEEKPTSLLTFEERALVDSECIRVLRFRSYECMLLADLFAVQYFH
jgi:hypothetical protein